MDANDMTPRLLAVDDDVASAELVVRVAERCGFEAFATSDSRGVVNLCRALDPAVLAVDICMPNIDAIELFDHLVAAGINCRIILVSGQDEAVLRNAQKLAISKGLGATDYVQKPIDLGTLRSILLTTNYAVAS